MFPFSSVHSSICVTVAYIPPLFYSNNSGQGHQWSSSVSFLIILAVITLMVTPANVSWGLIIPGKVLNDLHLLINLCLWIRYYYHQINNKETSSENMSLVLVTGSGRARKTTLYSAVNLNFSWSVSFPIFSQHCLLLEMDFCLPQAISGHRKVMEKACMCFW